MIKPIRGEGEILNVARVSGSNESVRAIACDARKQQRGGEEFGTVFVNNMMNS